MPPSSPIQRTGPFSRGDLLFLGCATLAGLVVGLLGILHYGYVGQDFPYHRALILLFPYTPLSTYYARTNPLALYWFANLVHSHVSAAHDLDIVAATFLVLNSLGLWVFYAFLWESIESRPLRFCAAVLATLVPFRVIHSIVIAADALTLPVFALAAVFVARLYRNPASALGWTGLCASLLVGMFCKYTFVGLLPPAALLLSLAIATKLKKGARLRWCLAGVVALALPAAAFLVQMGATSKLEGAITDQVWLKKGEPAVMRWSDILLLKASDRRLLGAPEYFRDKIYESGRFSYLGLLHVSTFTDCMGLFQPPPGDIAYQLRKLNMKPANRPRSPLSQRLQEWSAGWCVPFSILALLGSLACGFLGVATLVLRRPLVPEATLVMTALATGFYAPILLSLTRLADPYASGYWLPRLVLPALLVFLCLGFVLLDMVRDRLERLRWNCRPALALMGAYTLMACLLFVGFLA